MSNSDKTAAIPSLPAVGTLARSVLDYLHKNPLEEFDATDIALKWTVSVGKVHSELAEALNSKLLNLKVARKGAGGLKTYIAGSLLEAAYEAAAAAQPKAAPAASTTTAHATAAKKVSNTAKKAGTLPFDASRLLVRTDLAIPLTDKQRSKNAWDAVFARLTAPGHSIQLPAEFFRSANLACVMRKRHQHPGRFAAHRVSPEYCAIFRLNDDGSVPASIAPKA